MRAGGDTLAYLRTASRDERVLLVGIAERALKEEREERRRRDQQLALKIAEGIHTGRIAP